MSRSPEVRTPLRTIVLLLFVLHSFPVFAAGPRAILTRAASGERSIPGLVFKATDFEVKEGRENGGVVHFVEIEGEFRAPDRHAAEWNLIEGGRRILLPATSPEKASFLIKLRVNEKVTLTEILAVGPYGEIERERIGVVCAACDFPADGNGGKPKVDVRTYRITAGVGMGILHYRDVLLGAISQTAAIAKLSVDRPFGGTRWSLGGNVFSSFAVLSKSTESSVETLGANLRAGYLFPRIAAPWILRIYLGIYYTTTFGGTNDFGYRNLAGPQVFPTLTYRFQDGATLGGYLKYSPVSAGFRFYSLKNHELAAGTSYVFSRGFGVNLDLAWLELTGTGIGKVTFQTNTLSGSYRF